MASAAEECLASPGREAQAGSGRALPHALLPATTGSDGALVKVNRDLRMLIDCKRSLARAEDESLLLTEICRILVGPGGYRLAWFGFAGVDPDCSVRVAARAGHDSGYLERLRVSWSDDETGHGPTGRAIRERRAQVCRHIDTDPDFSPWREAAHREGYGASVALPLLLEGQCTGVLCIYAARPDAFDPAELTLLMELAADLAFGLNALRARAELCRQRQELQRLAQIVRVHSAINSAVIRLRNRDELLQEACRLAVELGGLFGAVVWVVDGTGRWAWLKYRAGAEVRDSETLQRLKIGDGSGPDPSLSGRALRTGKVMMCKDIVSADEPVAGRERLLARGIRSLIALPLIVEGRRVAVLTLTAREAIPAEDGELVQLLENIASSLSFALHSLESADAAQYLASFDPLT